MRANQVAVPTPPQLVGSGNYSHNGLRLSFEYHRVYSDPRWPHYVVYITSPTESLPNVTEDGRVCFDGEVLRPPTYDLAIATALLYLVGYAEFRETGCFSKDLTKTRFYDCG